MTETLLVDFAWTKPSPAAIKAAGYVGAIRYLSHDDGKDIEPDEMAALHAAGLVVVLVWETTANAAAGGSVQARNDAVFADHLADALGWPLDRPIYYATDFDANPIDVAPYYAALGPASKRPVGCYGGIRVVEAMLGGGHARYGWQTVAWSGGQVSDHAHLYQRISHTRPAIGGVSVESYDEDIALRPDFGQWPAPAEVAPHPKPVAPAVTYPCGPGQVWWEGHGARDPHDPKALPRDAVEVYTPGGARMAYWDDQHHGWTDVHLIPSTAKGVLGFRYAGGWKRA